MRRPGPGNFIGGGAGKKNWGLGQSFVSKIMKELGLPWKTRLAQNLDQ